MELPSDEGLTINMELTEKAEGVAFSFCSFCHDMSFLYLHAHAVLTQMILALFARLSRLFAQALNVAIWARGFGFYFKQVEIH